MGSSTQVEQNDFKAAIKKFHECIEIVKNKLSSLVKDKEGQAAELFKAVRLQKTMVFECDNESIPKVDFGVSATSVILWVRSIALNLLAQKQKRADSIRSKENTSKQVVFWLTKSLEKFLTFLACAFYSFWLNLPSSASTTLSLLFNNTFNTLSISNLDTRMTNMESKLGDVKFILGKILATISGETTTNNKNTGREEN